MSGREPVSTLVLVPGLLCTRTLWAHQIAHLDELAEIVVADVTGADTIEELADVVLDVAPRRFALCGLSMGGVIANAVMTKAPERVDRLALLDTHSRPETEEQTGRRQELLRLVAEGHFAEVPGKLLPWFLHHDRLHETGLANVVHDMAREVGPEAFKRQIEALIGRPDPRPAMTRYRCPCLVLCGREDSTTPVAFHEEMATLIPGARLAIVEQCGHLSTIERPQAVTALLRQWLLYG